MKENPDNFGDWMNEFSEFLNAEPVSPPQQITEHIHETIYNSLNPSPFLVFAKLAVLALTASSISLLFCPQFGLGTSKGGIMPYLMSVSPLLCHFGCGVVFVGSGMLAATLILSREELRVLKATKFLQVAALSATMLGLFVCLGAANLFALEWMWFLGGIIGGLVSVYCGSFIRKELLST